MVAVSYVMCAAPLASQNSTCSQSMPVSELVFLGTGVSTALPRISCIIRGRSSRVQTSEPDELQSYTDCEVCRRAYQDPSSPNRRGNVSALVRLGTYSVMIDCGKTARESCLRFFPCLGVRTADAVVLTHGHADAILGLDDLRDIQDMSKSHTSFAADGDLKFSGTPVFLNEQTLDDCKRCFPYLTGPVYREANEDFDDSGSQITRACKADEGDIPRRVSRVLWRVFSTYFETFSPVPGVHFTSVPLFHGGDYICSGFVIRGEFHKKSTVVYLSDVSKIPEQTMAFLDSLPFIDILVVDSLLRTERYASHFSLVDAIDLARRLKPTITRCVGMTCSLGLHEEVNEELAALHSTENLDIQLAYDGLRLAL